MLVHLGEEFLLCGLEVGVLGPEGFGFLITNAGELLDSLVKSVNLLLEKGVALVKLRRTLLSKACLLGLVMKPPLGLDYLVMHALLLVLEGSSHLVLSVLGLESHVRPLALKDYDLFGHGLDFTRQVAVSALVLVRLVAERGASL